MNALLDADKMVDEVEMPMQSNNFDDIKAHLNPTFEGPEKFDVQLTLGVLDIEKHSVVIFKKHSNSTEHSIDRRAEVRGASLF